MDRVVVFDCSDKIYVFEEGCRLTPRFPYIKFDHIHKAVDYLKKKGIVKPEIVIHERIGK